MIARLHRFHGHNSLSFVYKRGRVVRGQLLSLKSVPNTRREQYRVAVVVSRKVDKSAVVRNRIRRRIYEVVRGQGTAITQPYDLVFTAFSAQLASMSATELKNIVITNLQKAGVIASANSGDHGIVKPKDV